MQGMSYEKRIALGNQVPTLGQFQVIKQIPQYQTCEVHNLVPAPKNVPETLKHVVFNIERGVTLHETIDFLKMCPDLKDIDIIYANELDDGAERSGNQNVAMEIAKAIGMNYAYGLEFIELVNPNDEKGFHGNALFSRWPIRWAKAVHLPEQYNWYFDRQKRIGARVGIGLVRWMSAAVKSALWLSIWKTARTVRAELHKWMRFIRKSSVRLRRMCRL